MILKVSIQTQTLRMPTLTIKRMVTTSVNGFILALHERDGYYFLSLVASLFLREHFDDVETSVFKETCVCVKVMCINALVVSSLVCWLRKIFPTTGATWSLFSSANITADGSMVSGLVLHFLASCYLAENNNAFFKLYMKFLPHQFGGSWSGKVPHVTPLLFLIPIAPVTLAPLIPTAFERIGCDLMVAGVLPNGIVCGCCFLWREALSLKVLACWDYKLAQVVFTDP